MKLVPFILIISNTSKEHKRTQNAFHQSKKVLGGFQGIVPCSYSSKLIRYELRG